MTRTKAELIRHCKNLVKQKVRYLYGFKYEPVTEAKLKMYFKLYPSYYTKTKQETAKKYVGNYATDCSGLISSCTGTTRSSQQYHDTALYILPVTPYYQGKDTSGLAVWKPGHIGVSIGKNITIEAKGIDFGVCQTIDTRWTHYLYLADIDYTPESVIVPSSPISDIMWMQDRINKVLGTNLEVDGQWGAKTTEAIDKFATQIGKHKYCKKGKKCTLGMLEELM